MKKFLNIEITKEVEGQLISTEKVKKKKKKKQTKLHPWLPHWVAGADDVITR